MTTFLVFSITSRKEIELIEIEINDLADEIDPWEHVKQHINPPYNGRCLVVEKDNVKIFRLKTEVIESK